MATRNLVPRNDNEGKVGTGAKKWQAINAYKLYGKLQVQDYTTASSTESTDLIPIYDQSNSEVRAISVGDLNVGSGIGVMDVRPDDVSLDDTNTGNSRGDVFGMFETIDFPNTATGSIWYSYKFPDSWNTSEDINLEIAYALSGNDPSKVVTVKIDAWLVETGDQPDPAAADYSGSDNISTDSTNIGKYSEATLNNGSITSASIPSGTKSVVIKLTRDVGSDTYTGTLQLIGIRISSGS